MHTGYPPSCYYSLKNCDLMSNPSLTSRFSHDIKDEFFQIKLRIGFVLFCALAVSLWQIFLFKLDIVRNSYIYLLFALVIIYNIFYYFFIRYFPERFILMRLIIVIAIDISITVYEFYLVEDFSALFVPALLWYIVGYGMRYGVLMGYIASIITIICWLFLINLSSFWIENKYFSYGWAFAFILIPQYYFVLVKRLHKAINKLNIAYKNVEHEAQYDHLTDLPNRSFFQIKLTTMLSEAIGENSKIALYFIDLDNFKQVNDTQGHDIGDSVLIEAAIRLQDISEDYGSIARLGGDEFVCIVNYENKTVLTELAQKIVQTLARPFESTDVHISASVGISLYPDDTQDQFMLKKYADRAMYEAKQRNKSTFVFYHELTEQKIQRF